MPNIKLNLEHSGVKEKEIMKYKETVEKIHDELHKISRKKDEYARMA